MSDLNSQYINQKYNYDIENLNENNFLSSTLKSKIQISDFIKDSLNIVNDLFLSNINLVNSYCALELVLNPINHEIINEKLKKEQKNNNQKYYSSCIDSIDKYCKGKIENIEKKEFSNLYPYFDINEINNKQNNLSFQNNNSDIINNENKSNNTNMSNDNEELNQSLGIFKNNKNSENSLKQENKKNNNKINIQTKKYKENKNFSLISKKTNNLQTSKKPLDKNSPSNKYKSKDKKINFYKKNKNLNDLKGSNTIQTSNTSKSNDNSSRYNNSSKLKNNNHNDRNKLYKMIFEKRNNTPTPKKKINLKQNDYIPSIFEIDENPEVISINKNNKCNLIQNIEKESEEKTEVHKKLSSTFSFKKL